MNNRWNDARERTNRTLLSRRTLARSIVATSTLGGLGVGTASARSDADEHDSDERVETIALEQDGQCVELEPLEGDEPVEDHYDYTYPQDRYEGPPGSDGDSFSSEGTRDLQRDFGSILYLYRGPEGLSLVIVHGMVDGDHDGGTVSFGISGLPADGEWVVQDDYYLRPDGEEARSNFDIWDIEGDDHVIHWAFRAQRTDGGAFRSLEDDLELVIAPAFNDRATLSDEYDFGEIDHWEVLSGDIDDPDRIELAMDQPIRITDGHCPS